MYAAAPQPPQEPIHTEPHYVYLPCGAWGWLPMLAEEVGFAPSCREWYAPIEDEV